MHCHRPEANQGVSIISNHTLDPNTIFETSFKVTVKFYTLHGLLSSYGQILHLTRSNFTPYTVKFYTLHGLFSSYNQV